MFVKCLECRAIATITPTSANSYDQYFEEPPEYCCEMNNLMRLDESSEEYSCSIMDAHARDAFTRWRERMGF